MQITDHDTTDTMNYTLRCFTFQFVKESLYSYKWSLLRAVFNTFLALVLLYYALWLVLKARANHDLVTRVFPALGADYVYLLRVLIGSLFSYVVTGQNVYFGFVFTDTQLKTALLPILSIDCFHMKPRRPYWFSQTMKLLFFGKLVIFFSCLFYCLEHQYGRSENAL